MFGRIKLEVFIRISCPCSNEKCPAINHDFWAYQYVSADLSIEEQKALSEALYKCLEEHVKAFEVAHK